MTHPDVTVIGAGLAGVEATHALTRHGVSVRLIDQKPCLSPPYTLETAAELVCSNSLKATDPETASGLLKREMSALGSLLLHEADAARLSTSGGLTVDRTRMSAAIERRLAQNAYVERRSARVTTLPTDTAYTIVATGPLTDSRLLACVAPSHHHFFDATAPIVAAESIDRSAVYEAGRYGKGAGDYWNCPLTRDAYVALREALCQAPVAPLSDYDDRVFAHCQPIERLAKLGDDTMRFGPLRPVGLRDPRTGDRPYAVVQLRRENASGSMLGLVGFQTRLTFAAQREVFALIPALRHATYHRFGRMHRNSYVDGPQVLTDGNAVMGRPGLVLAGQITGVEGYMESAASGLIAGRYVWHRLVGLSHDQAISRLPGPTTMIGALMHYVVASPRRPFLPMNANFGLFDDDGDAPRAKAKRHAYWVARSDRAMARLVEESCDER